MDAEKLNKRKDKQFGHNSDWCASPKGIQPEKQNQCDSSRVRDLIDFWNSVARTSEQYACFGSDSINSSISSGYETGSEVTEDTIHQIQKKNQEGADNIMGDSTSMKKQLKIKKTSAQYTCFGSDSINSSISRGYETGSKGTKDTIHQIQKKNQEGADNIMGDSTSMKKQLKIKKTSAQYTCFGSDSINSSISSGYETGSEVTEDTIHQIQKKNQEGADNIMGDSTSMKKQLKIKKTSAQYTCFGSDSINSSISSGYETGSEVTEDTIHQIQKKNQEGADNTMGDSTSMKKQLKIKKTSAQYTCFGSDSRHSSISRGYETGPEGTKDTIHQIQKKNQEQGADNTKGDSTSMKKQLELGNKRTSAQYACFGSASRYSSISSVYETGSEGTQDTVHQIQKKNQGNFKRWRAKEERTTVAESINENKISQEIVQESVPNNAVKRQHINSSPIHIASSKGFSPIVSDLIAKGADVNICDDEGLSPLYLACFSEHTEIVKILLNSGADANICSPLCAASEFGNTDIVRLLLHKGAYVNQCNDEGLTPLYLACFNEHSETVQLLLENGAEANMCSPLCLMSEFRNAEIVQMLLDNGANINQCNDEGKSALYLACLTDHKDTIDILLKNGADPNV